MEYPPPQKKLHVPASAPHLPNNILALYLGQQALERCGESVLCSLHASSGELRHSSGELWRGRQNFARSWILGRNGFLWSFKVKLYILGVLGALSPALANLARARHNRITLQVNRITGQVLVRARTLPTPTQGTQAGHQNDTD